MPHLPTQDQVWSTNLAVHFGYVRWMLRRNMDIAEIAYATGYYAERWLLDTSNHIDLYDDTYVLPAIERAVAHFDRNL